MEKLLTNVSLSATLYDVSSHSRSDVYTSLEAFPRFSDTTLTWKEQILVGQIIIKYTLTFRSFSRKISIKNQMSFLEESHLGAQNEINCDNLGAIKLFVPFNFNCLFSLFNSVKVFENLLRI